jgi:hypothetical protein
MVVRESGVFGILLIFHIIIRCMLVWWEFGRDVAFEASLFFKETVQVFSFLEAALTLELLSKLGSPYSIPLYPRYHIQLSSSYGWRKRGVQNTGLLICHPHFLQMKHILIG